MQPLWDFLQTVETKAEMLTSDLSNIKDIICAGIAVFILLHWKWLNENPRRIDWCRLKLQAFFDNPPPRRQFDMELTANDKRWDFFSAQCGTRLLVENQQDRLARRLIAESVVAFHYDTTAVTMTSAAEQRDRLGTTFNQLVTLALNWAALRPLQARSPDPALEPERKSWDNHKQRLIRQFTDGSLDSARPDLHKANAKALDAMEALHAKRFPEYRRRSKRDRGAVVGSRSREVLHAKQLGLDAYVLKAAFQWLHIGSARNTEERDDWFGLIQEFCSLLLDSIPMVESLREQEIEGLPSDFDDWTFGIIAQTIAHVADNDRSQTLWQPLFDRGAAAHEWIERFFWYWFTNGFQAAKSPEHFIRIWRSMIVYALDNPGWEAFISGFDDMVFELLGFDLRWNVFVKNEALAAEIKGLVDVFDRVAQKWFQMPKVLNGFVLFAVYPGASGLLIPGLSWVLLSVKSFTEYDWRYGLEENLATFLHVCWQREGDNITNDVQAKDTFLALLTRLAARGCHAAIALQNRVLGTKKALNAPS